MLYHPENSATQHCQVTRLRVLADAAAAGAMPSIHPCSRAALAPARRWASKLARGHCRLSLQGRWRWSKAREGRSVWVSSSPGCAATQQPHAAHKGLAQLHAPSPLHTCLAPPPGC